MVWMHEMRARLVSVRVRVRVVVRVRVWVRVWVRVGVGVGVGDGVGVRGRVRVRVRGDEGAHAVGVADHEHALSLLDLRQQLSPPQVAHALARV